MNRILASCFLVSAAASQAELGQEQFDNLWELCLPPESEAAWMEVGWETDLWKAREQAAREGKPIFLWEMDGHPLGCT